MWRIKDPDPDPGYPKRPYPIGSGSATLVQTVIYLCIKHTSIFQAFACKQLTKIHQTLVQNIQIYGKPLYTAYKYTLVLYINALYYTDCTERTNILLTVA